MAQTLPPKRIFTMSSTTSSPDSIDFLHPAYITREAGLMDWSVPFGYPDPNNREAESSFKSGTTDLLISLGLNGTQTSPIQSIVTSDTSGLSLLYTEPPTPSPVPGPIYRSWPSLADMGLAFPGTPIRSGFSFTPPPAVAALPSLFTGFTIPAISPISPFGPAVPFHIGSDAPLPPAPQSVLCLDAYLRYIVCFANYNLEC